MKIINISFTFILIASLTISSVVTGQNICESASGFLTSLPPEVPILISPSDQAESLPDSIIVVWHSRIHTGLYTLQVSALDDFSNLFVSEIGVDTLFALTGLAKGATYYWRVCGNNAAGASAFTEAWRLTTASSSAVDAKKAPIPHRYALLPVYPNPFNPTTTITYHLPEPAEVALVIYNSMGQSVRQLVSGLRQAGEYRVTWDGSDGRGISVTSGLYLCHVKAGSHVFTQKILLIR